MFRFAIGTKSIKAKEVGMPRGDNRNTPTSKSAGPSTSKRVTRSAASASAKPSGGLGRPSTRSAAAARNRDPEGVTRSIRSRHVRADASVARRRRHGRRARGRPPQKRRRGPGRAMVDGFRRRGVRKSLKFGRQTISRASKRGSCQCGSVYPSFLGPGCDSCVKLRRGDAAAPPPFLGVTENAAENCNNPAFNFHMIKY